MKKPTRRDCLLWSLQIVQLLMIASAFTVLLTSKAHAADWVQDWFDQAAVTNPGSMKTQERGYYTGGAFQARWRMTNDYPVTISPPRLQAGCGGIDMFGGGFSFMDPEYLVEKLERSIQAAPAVAFQMAMSQYCKDCVTAMNTMEEVTDWLNSIQMNDCRMAKGIAAIPTKGDTSYFTGMYEKAAQEYALVSGQLKNGQHMDDKVHSADGKSPVEIKDAVSDCPAAFTQVFSDGSVVENITQLVSLDGYADLMRGLLGDVYVKYDSGYKNYRFTTVEACQGNDPASENDLLTGQMQKRTSPAPGTCSTSSSKPVQDEIRDRLYAIADKLAAKGSGGARLSAADMTFISGAPFSVYNMLRDAVKEGYVDEAINQSVDILAAAYAAHMMNDMHTMARLVFAKADEINANATTATSNQKHCNADFLKPAVEQLRAMDERALIYRQMAMANYAKAQGELNANLQFASYLRDHRRNSVTNDASSVR